MHNKVHNKSVVLSIGGATGNIDLQSEQEAKLFAESCNDRIPGRNI